MELDVREAKLQKHRLQMTSMGMTNGLLQSGVLALYAMVGSVTWNIVLAFLVVHTAFALGFACVVARNWNLRFKDKSMLLPQIVGAMGIQLIFMIAAPQLSVIFLTAILGCYYFAMAGFSSSQFRIVWVCCGALTAAVMYLGRGRFAYPGATDVDMAILWLYFFLTAGRLSILGTQFGRLRSKLSEKNHALQEALEKNANMANRDDLTGVWNRRHFMQDLDNEQNRSNRTQQEFCVAMFDLDHFKLVNDGFGHPVGDVVLREFCAISQSCIRSIDRFARFGGEEFVLLLSAPTTLQSAAIAADRIRLAVETHAWGRVAPGLRITVSCGVAIHRPGEGASQLISRADDALYDAKHRGRNRVVMAPNDLQAPEEVARTENEPAAPVVSEAHVHDAVDAA